jgi:GTP-binding protein
MFIDVASVLVCAGDGGNGKVSFRRERYVAKGGPDGGDGGDGGDIVFVASNNENTLANFRYQKELKAPDGGGGENAKRHGKNGRDLEVNVPVGTQVFSGDKLLADLTEVGQRFIVAKGGKGGFGNAHFTSSTRQTPRVAEKGEEGQQLECKLELKMIADVGLVGLPNAGKSTLLAKVSNAKPEIADYAFTTLRPNLGVVKVDGIKELLLADIPGLIEGASQGKGLGDEFLRHVERTTILVHLIDAYNDDVVSAYKTIQSELKAYKIDMSSKPQVIALNKIEGLDQEIVADLSEQLRQASKQDKIYAISSQSGEGLKELLYDVYSLVEHTRKQLADARTALDELPVVTLDDQKHIEPWTVEVSDDQVIVKGQKIERFAAKTDFENEDATQRLRDIMRKMGILRKLELLQAQPGVPIYFGENRKNSLEY